MRLAILLIFFESILGLQFAIVDKYYDSSCTQLLFSQIVASNSLDKCLEGGKKFSCSGNTFTSVSNGGVDCSVTNVTTSYTTECTQTNDGYFKLRSCNAEIYGFYPLTSSSYETDSCTSSSTAPTTFYSATLYDPNCIAFDDTHTMKVSCLTDGSIQTEIFGNTKCTGVPQVLVQPARCFQTQFNGCLDLPPSGAMIGGIVGGALVIILFITLLVVYHCCIKDRCCKSSKTQPEQSPEEPTSSKKEVTRPDDL